MKIARVEAMILRAGDDTSQAAARPRMGTISRSARALDGGYDIDRSRAAYPGCMQTVLVRVTSDEGLVGYGEAHAPLAPEVTRAVVDNLLAPVIVGEDPRAVDVLWERMYTSMRIRGHRTGFMMEAMSGVDIALWDLFGKAVGLPVYRLLGGGYRNRANAYASGVPGATPEARARNALGFLDEGFTAMKLGLGGRGPKASIPFVRAVREAVGDRAHLMVDAQGGYDFYTALAFGRALEEWNVYWVEDPLPPEDISGHRKLTASLDMAVATGEALCARWGFRPWITTGALDVILPDVCRAGGISECHKIANMADAFNIPWAGHVSMGTCVHIAATLHLAAATPNFLICECPASFRTNPLGNVLLEKALDLQDGQFAVPQGPGLGIAFDEEALRGCVVEE
ncbi:MAG: mandelate racemase/muconate lactonizing enzyme family protein [Anaerolineales bacterium]